MISYAVKNAIISTNKGKDYRLFPEEKKAETLNIETKEHELAELEKIFGKLE